MSMLEIMQKIFLYAGIGFAVFSMLLFYNFISTSINNKRHEIGILRAIGARGGDVFKIFYSEALIIAAINFVLAVAGLFAVSTVINVLLKNSAMQITLLVPGIIEIGLVFAVAFVTATVSAFLPVNKIAHQKPIDAIREK